jgi:hypothetical protein
VEHIVADEKQTTLKKEKVFIATTVSNNCFLGAEVCANADETALTKGYSTFAKEAKNIDENYQPMSVNIDGWDATCKAFNALFTGITIIFCFLHGYIKIRDRCRKSPLFTKICGHIWHVYQAENKKTFSQRIRRLKDWANAHLSPGGALTKINVLYDKSSLYQRAYDHPDAYRTSNMVDRLMRWLDRSLFARQYFHGTLTSANNGVRAWALLRNYYPYCLRKLKDNNKLVCAASELNGFVYSSNWLENLIAASSMNGYRQ